MASFHLSVKAGKKGTAADHARYITRQGRFRHREDLVATEFGNLPKWANEPVEVWKAADKYERSGGTAYKEQQMALPSELTTSEQLELVRTWVAKKLPNKPYQWAVHRPTSSLEGVQNAHVHLMYTDRADDGVDRPPEQMFRRYNAKTPHLGGRKKDSGGKAPSVLREELVDERKAWAELQNEALARHGHAIRVDHRSLRDQGLDREPERHLGPAKIRGMTTEDKLNFISAR